MSTQIRPADMGITDSLTGTTTDAYVSALDWRAEGFGEKTIVLKNTDGANSLDYKVLVRANYGGQDFEDTAETALAAGDMARILLLRPYARAQVQVKATTPGSQATWQVDYIGMP